MKRAKECALYMICKPLEKKASEKGGNLSLTAYGKLIPTASGGKHEFRFEFPLDSDKHRGKGYVENSSSMRKVTTGNCFHP